MRQVEEPSHVVVFTDSHRAGCLKTCKRTSSSKLFYGSHMLRSTSAAQRVIALSSGESEFYKGGISNPADLGTKKHLDGGSIRRALERCHCYVREEGLQSRCEQKYKKARDNILKFSLSMMQLNLRRSQKHTWKSDSDDTGSSDSGGTETVAGPKWCKPTVNRHAPPHKQNLNKL